MTKLRAEEASLRDSLSKLSALNESLAQDKLGLNRLVAQVRRASRPVCLTQQSSPLGDPTEGSLVQPRPTPHALPGCTSPWTPLPLCLSVWVPATPYAPVIHSVSDSVFSLML